MKKNATRYCAGPAYYRMANRRLPFKTKPAAGSTKGKPSPIISSFLELGRRKLSMQPKFVAAQKMLLKQKPSKHSVNGLLGFITLGIYTPLEARVLLTIIA